jgi:acyl-[acyl-carrier-protein]-phospholipid O-acyltransferase / long-chain-fatty-acid--[acyl-carrier-protein] ligase
MTDSPSFETPEVDRPLWNAGYIGVLLTQFLGSFNDNLLRWLSVCVAEQIGLLGGLKGEEAASWKTLMLVLGGVSFTLPYLFLMPLSGSLADRFSKRSVMVVMKVAEILIMCFAVTMIVQGHVWMMFLSVGLMGAQSALFGPSRFGSMPEILPNKHLSEGNGFVGLATVVACALGAAAGFKMYGVVEHGITAEGVTVLAFWPAALALIGTGVAGTLTSLMIPRLAAGNPDFPLKINPLTETIPALQILWKDVRLVRTTFGIAFFWFLASLAQVNVDPLGGEVLGMAKENIGLLLAVLVAGLGTGSVLAGFLSEGKVELGLVPFGALGITISSLMVWITGSMVDPHTVQVSFYLCCASLFLLGAAAGMFNIPLETYLQYRSDPAQRGMILAGCNFITFLFILLSLGLFHVLSSTFGLSPTAIYAVAGLGTIPVLVYVLRLMPDLTFRFFLYLVSHTLYRLKVHGRENVPEKGGALIVVNHVSFMDGVLMMGACSRIARFIIYADFTRMPLLKPFGEMMRVIPIKASEGPKALIRSLQQAKQALLDGDLVCIFAEGQITRTGQLQQFQRGMMKIVEGTNCPVIPAYLHGLWGSFFSYRGGKPFGAFPTQWNYPVSIQFGEPIKHPEDAHEVRQAVQQLGVEAVERDKTRELIPVRQFIRRCKRDRSCPKVADSLGTELTGYAATAGARGHSARREDDRPADPAVGRRFPGEHGGRSDGTDDGQPELHTFG